MKRAILTIAGLIWALVFQAQTTLPNGDFEQWNSNKPSGWDASNYQILTIAIQTVFQDTISPKSGSYSVRLKSNTFNIMTVQQTIPGIITLGTIIVNTANFSGTIDGGIPFNGRPLSLKGYIHAMPASGDSAMIALGFSKWNGSKRDTIGEGIGWFATPGSGWEPFDIPITFSTSGQPDSMNIIISSSAVGNEVVVSGSEVKIDDLSLDYGSIIINLPTQHDGFTVWANGDRQLYYSLSNDEIDPVQLNLYSIHGVPVRNININHHAIQGSLDLHGLPPGVYVISIITSDQKILNRKFVLR